MWFGGWDAPGPGPLGPDVIHAGVLSRRGLPPEALGGTGSPFRGFTYFCEWSMNPSPRLDGFLRASLLGGSMCGGGGCMLIIAAGGGGPGRGRA